MQKNNTLVSSADIGTLDADVLCVPSPLLDSSLPSLLQWLEGGDRYVLVLWDEASLDSFIDISPRIRSYVLQEPLEDSFKQIAWDYVFLRVKLWDDSWKHKALFEKTLLGVHLVASDSEDFGKKVISNVRQNALQQKQYFSLDALKGSMQGIPAIVCGAGSSLSENMLQLLELRSSALILAGGSAITALASRSIFFHAAAGLDPEPDYKRFIESSAFEIPFFYQDRFSSKILSMVQGQKVRLPSASEYPFEEWLKTEQGSNDPAFDGGWTVATLMTAIATHLGCSPIIFVGMDFGYEDTMYSQELSYSEHSEKTAVNEIDRIKMKSDWIMARHWMHEWIQAHPECRFINTSSISEFIGAEKSSLKLLKQNELRHCWDIAGELHAALEEAKMKGSHERTQNALQELSESICRTKRLLESMVKVFGTYYLDRPTSKGEFILLEYDLYDELSYKVLIEPVWSIWKHVFARIEELSYDQRRLHEILFFQKIINEHE